LPTKVSFSFTLMTNVHGFEKLSDIISVKFLELYSLFQVLVEVT
jgi:hypothetical protein